LIPEFDNQLIGNELDYVFVGQYNGNIRPNPLEVKNWKYAALQDITNDIKMRPNIYTSWFKIIISKPELLTAIEYFK